MTQTVTGVAAWSLWGLVGAMMLMFGVAWCFAIRLTTPTLTALRGVIGFNLCTGLGLLTMGISGGPPALPVLALASMLQIAGVAMLWVGCAALVGRPIQRGEPHLVAAIGCTAQVVLLVVGATSQVHGAVVWISVAWMVARGGGRFARRLCSAEQSRGGVWPMLATVAVTLAMLLRLAAGLASHEALGVLDVVPQVRWLFAYVCTIAIVAVNLVLTYHVFGRVVAELNRLKRQDPLTGLADRPAVLRAIRHEWHASDEGAPCLAVLALAVDGLAALRAQHGSATADAVVAEVALHLRMAARPFDLLAHAGEGHFVLAMPRTDRVAAQRWAGAVLGSVTADVGLHPEAGERLTLSAGLAAVGPGLPPVDTPQALLERAERRCRRALRAGGTLVLGRDGAHGGDSDLALAG